MLIEFPHTSFKSSKKKFVSLLLFVMLLFQLGCSPANRIRVLSFFFDGVTDPSEKVAAVNDSLNSADTTSMAQNLAAEVAVQTHFHPPYRDKQCNTCHDQSSMGKLKLLQPDLCYQCHDNFSLQYKVLHGPVGGGQCNMCHSPHMSENPALTIRVGQDLCLYCHESSSILKTVPHQNTGESDCTVCHNPHGGTDNKLLR